MSAKLVQTRRRRYRLGNALLDAALVLPILLSLTFGTVEYGYFFFVKHSMQGAAREGCRVGILPTSDNTQVRSAIATSLYAAGLNASQSSLDGKYTLTTTPANVSGVAAGTSITVQVDCTWGSIGVRPLGLIGAAKVVRGTTVMRKKSNNRTLEIRTVGRGTSPQKIKGFRQILLNPPGYPSEPLGRN